MPKGNTSRARAVKDRREFTNCPLRTLIGREERLSALIRSLYTWERYLTFVEAE